MARVPLGPEKGRSGSLAVCAGMRLTGGIALDVISLHKTELKQPFLKVPGGVLPCSISHVAGIVAAAVATPDLSVGIDVEHVSRFEAMELGLIEAILSPTERARREDWPAEELLRVWSLKESFVKAAGTGFRDRPNTYELAQLLADQVHDLGDGRFWRHVQYPVGQGHWITLGVFGYHRDDVEKCELGHQLVQMSEIP